MPVYTGIPSICEALSVYECFLIKGIFPVHPVCKKLLALNNNTVTFFRLEMVVKGKIPDRIKQKNKFLKRFTIQSFIIIIGLTYKSLYTS